jgi:hypothetical protein
MSKGIISRPGNEFVKPIWWGEAPVRLQVLSEKIGTANRRDRLGLWRAEPWSNAGPRLGASFGVTH